MWQKFVGMATITLVVCGLLACAVTPVQAQQKAAPEKFAVGDIVDVKSEGGTLRSWGRVVGYDSRLRKYRVEHVEEVFNPEPTAVLAPPKKTVLHFSASELAKSNPAPPAEEPKVADEKLPPLELPPRKFADGHPVNVKKEDKLYLGWVTGHIPLFEVYMVKLAVDGKEEPVPAANVEEVGTVIAIGDNVEVTPPLDGKRVGKVLEASWISDFVTVEYMVLDKKEKWSFKGHEVTKIAPKPLPRLWRSVLSETDPKLSIGRIDFSDDDRLVAVQWSDGIISLNKVADGAKAEQNLKRYEFKETVGDRTIANGGYVGHGFTWAFENPELVVVSEKTIQRLLVGEVDHWLLAANTFDDLDRAFQAFAISPDGEFIAAASRRLAGLGEWKDPRIDIFDATADSPPAEDKRVQLKKLQLITGQIDAMAYSPDGKFLAINGKAGNEHIVEVYPVRGRGVFSFNTGGSLLAFSPDAKHLATGREIHELADKIEDAGFRQVKLKTALEPNAVVYDPKGKWIATGGADRRLAFWDPATGEKLASIRAADRAITALAVSHDGATIATTAAYKAEEDGEATLWDVAAILREAPKEEALAKLAATPHAADAFEFGLGWGQEMFEWWQKERPKTPGKKTAALAKTLGVTLPDFPSASSVDEFLKQYGGQGEALAAETKQRHGASHEQLFTLGVQLNLVVPLYRPDAAAKNLPTVDVYRQTIEQCCRDLELTDAVTRRLTARIAANDGVQNIGYEVGQIAREVRSVLYSEPVPDGK